MGKGHDVSLLPCLAASLPLCLPAPSALPGTGTTRHTCGAGGLHRKYPRLLVLHRQCPSRRAHVSALKEVRTSWDEGM
ncbi:hypothetical protein T484DRAFT_1941410 [Baffinella frigidus]|nr:hypothetical protein T484DRAFT_1941410 [Cryptophyta sp. CCMP2293]